MRRFILLTVLLVFASGCSHCSTSRTGTINQTVSFIGSMTFTFDNLSLTSYGIFGTAASVPIKNIKYQVTLWNNKSNLFMVNIPAYKSNILCAYYCMEDTNLAHNCPDSFTELTIITEDNSVGNVFIYFQYCDEIPTSLVSLIIAIVFIGIFILFLISCYIMNCFGYLCYIFGLKKFLQSANNIKPRQQFSSNDSDTIELSSNFPTGTIISEQEISPPNPSKLSHAIVQV